MSTPTVLLVPGDPAPPIQSQAVLRGDVVDLTLDEALKGVDFLLLVFYPADFTFVCPTEIVQFTEKFADFAQHRCNVVCCSTDSVYTHLAWLKAPKSERGLGAPDSGSIVLLSDRSHEISRAYGVLAASGAAYRGTFLIDSEKTICQVTINDMPVGRSVDDALRMLKELLLARSGEPVGRGPANNGQQVNSSNAGPSVELAAAKSRQGQHLSRADRDHRQKLRRHHRQQCQQQYQQQYQQQQMVLRPAAHYLQSAAHDKLLLLKSIEDSSVSDYARPGQAQGRHQQQQQQPETTQAQQQQQQQQRSWEPPGPVAARAAQLETRAAQLRLKDSEERLARLLADEDRLRSAAERQLADTQALKTTAMRKQSEWEQLLTVLGTTTPPTRNTLVRGEAGAGDESSASATATRSRLVLPPPMYHREPPVQ